MSRNKMIAINSSILMFFFLFTFLVNAETVQAWDWGWGDTTAETVEFLEKHSEWLKYGGMVTVILTTFQWLLVKGLFIIVSAVEGLIPESFTILDFLNDIGVGNLTSAIIDDLVVALMVLTIAFLGIKMVIGKEPPKFKNMTTNIIISGILIAGLPSLMQKMQDISISFYDATQTDSAGVSSLSWNLIKDNTADLVYVAENGFDLIANESTAVKNALTPEIFKSVDLSELITPDLIKDLDGEEIEQLNYTLTNNGAGGFTATKIKGNKLSFFSDTFDTGYLRYPAKFLPILVGLLALMVAYFFAIFVLITTFIEIGIKQIVGYFVFATDLESGQRTKMVLQDIMNAYMLIAFTGLNFKIYSLFLAYLGTADVNFIIYIVALVSSTLILIKGSSTIMRYFGVDVGLKEGLGQMAGAFGLGRATAGLFKKGKGSGKKKDKSEGQEDLKREQEEKDKASINDGNSPSKLNKSINSLGNSIGYGMERGASGLASDGVEKMKDAINKPIKNASGTAKSIKDGFREGLDEGTVSAVKKNMKPSSITKDAGQAKEFEPEHATRIAKRNEQVNYPTSDKSEAAKETAKQNQSNAQEQMRQDLKQRIIEASEGGTDKAREEFVKQKRSEAKYNPEAITRKEMIEQKNEQKKNNFPVKYSKTISDTSELKDSPKMNAGGSGTKQNTTNDAIRQTVNQDIKSANQQNSGTRQIVDQEVKSAKQNMSNDTIRQTVNQDIKSANQQNSGTRQTVNQDIKSANQQNSGTRQTVNQDVKSSNQKNNEIRQSVVQETKSNLTMPKQLTQQINQEVQGAKRQDLGQVQQRVIQSIEKSAIGTQEAKQRVVQQVAEANIATPKQTTQNIERRVKNANLPTEAKQSVQKVIQEVQKSNFSSKDITQKVVQKLQTTNLGSKEEFKQKIIQEIQKAPEATPKQVKENIKQVIEKVEVEGNSFFDLKDNPTKDKEKKPFKRRLDFITRG